MIDGCSPGEHAPSITCPVFTTAFRAGAVIVSLTKDDTELFKQLSDNESFKKWLTDTVFTATYEPRPKP